MKHLFNQFIIKIIPYLPLFLIRTVALKYVAGETTKDAMRIVADLNKQGFAVTLDILGEHTKDEKTAKIITNHYYDLLKEIHQNNLNCNLSIKLSHIGMDISTECLDDNISHLIKNAMECKNFIRIDMENSNTVDTTINLYKNIKKQYEQIGIVFQAYLYRTENDLYSFKDQQGFNFRLCKGIYKESSELAIQNHEGINNNFLKLLRFAFDNNIYVGIATHDLSLIKKIYQMINECEISKDNFEFQVLYGVPMSGWLEKHLEHGYKVRIYVPFGEDWYEYSMRRLKENPDIAGYIIKDLFRT